MSISAVSGQSGQSAQSDTSSLEASKKKIETEIKQLQKEDATKNAKEIQILQQEAQQIEVEIAQQKSKSQLSSQSANTSAEQNVGPAYSVQLGNQTIQTSSKTLNEVSSETSQTVDLSI